GHRPRLAHRLPWLCGRRSAGAARTDRHLARRNAPAPGHRLLDASAVNATPPDIQAPYRLLGCPAPAKLNLFLHVVGRRADGYHLLQTAFRLLDWGDTLDFTQRADGNIVRVTEVAGVPAEQDL